MKSKRMIEAGISASLGTAPPAALPRAAPLPNRRRVAVIEVTALIALLLSYIWGWQGAFAGSFFVVLILYFGVGLTSHVLRRESLHDIGLRLDNLPRALANGAMIFVPAIAITLLIGLALDSWHFTSLQRVVVGAPTLYAWALAQQYGLLCFLYRRFVDIFGQEPRAAASAAVTFALFHAPNPFLAPVTLAAGLAACTLYRREPNVLVIGLGHAMISYCLLCSLPLSVTHGLRVGPGFFALH
jgi:CAAX prenyl protease-like protein